MSGLGLAPAYAELASVPAEPGQAYFTLAFGRGDMQASNFTYGHNSSATAPAFDFDDSTSGIGLDVSLGYMLREESRFSWLGQNTRAELSLAYATDHDDKIGRTPVGTRVPFINGNPPNLQFTTANDYTYDLNQRHNGLDLLLGGDFETGLWHTKVTPFIGLSYFKRQEKSELVSIDPGPGVADLRMKQTLESDYSGLKLGATFSRHIGSSVNLFLGGSVSWLRAKTELQANQHFVTYPAPPGTFAQVSEDETESALHKKFILGISYTLKPTRIALVLESKSLNYVPIVVNRVYFSDPALHLEDDDMTERSVKLLFSVPFNH